MTSSTDLMQPIININGTDRTSLVSARVDAMIELRSALAMLRLLYPNGRDYPNNKEALARDEAIHRQRVATLMGLLSALEKEALAIQEQPTC